MSQKHLPTEEQLFKLYSFLTFLKKNNIYWYKALIDGSKIRIHTEPLKSEIDIRIFYIDKEGRVDDDGFGENRLL